MLNKENAKGLEIKNPGSYKIFTFECYECGADIKAQTVQLKTHSGKYRKCSQRGRPYEHVFNELLRTTKREGKYTKVSITYEEFIEIISVSKCHYCSKDLIFNMYNRNYNGEHVSRAYQLDRKNNDLGYTNDNVVPCCFNCNRMKSNVYSYEEFMKLSPILKEINIDKNK